MVIGNKTIKGEGHHPEAGKFTIDGKVNGKKLTFCKTYGETSHKIYYQGTLTGNDIKGHWSYQFGFKVDTFTLSRYQEPVVVPEPVEVIEETKEEEPLIIYEP